MTFLKSKLENALKESADAQKEMRQSMDEPTRQAYITQKAKELLFPTVHNDIIDRFKKVGPAPVYWHEDSEN